MNEMIERVAKALYDKDDELSMSGNPEWSKAWIDVRRYWEEMARAAIEAMREPTEAMKEAIEDIGDDEGYGIVTLSDAEFFWHQMIDAALAESKEG